MESKYDIWISEYGGDIFRKCKEVSNEMQRVFPELRIAKGLVQIIEDMKWYQHQWLVDSDDNIVDPTSGQWLGIVEYKEIKEGDATPIGKCMNCGEIVFSNSIYGSYACSELCYNDLMY